MTFDERQHTPLQEFYITQETIKMASSGDPHTGSSKPVCIVQKRGFILSFVEHSHRTRLDPSHDEMRSWLSVTEDNDHVVIRAPEL